MSLHGLGNSKDIFAIKDIILWPGGSVGWSIVLYTKRLQVQFLGRVLPGRPELWAPPPLFFLAHMRIIQARDNTCSGNEIVSLLNTKLQVGT